MKINFVRIFLTILLSALCSCSEEESQTVIPLPRGLYNVSGPYCESSGESPHYPHVKYAAALFDFENLITRTLNRLSPSDAFFVQEIYESKDCKLTVNKDALVTVDGYFGTGLGRTFSWEPAGCKLSVSSLSDSLSIGENYSEQFQNLESSRADLLYEVEYTGTFYSVKTANVEPYLSAWTEYGCLEQDQIRFELTRISQ
jgi:hypothetical protein